MRRVCRRRNLRPARPCQPAGAEERACGLVDLSGAKRESRTHILGVETSRLFARSLTTTTAVQPATYRRMSSIVGLASASRFVPVPSLPLTLPVIGHTLPGTGAATAWERRASQTGFFNAQERAGISHESYTIKGAPYRLFYLLQRAHHLPETTILPHPIDIICIARTIARTRWRATQAEAINSNTARRAAIRNLRRSFYFSNTRFEIET